MVVNCEKKAIKIFITGNVGSGKTSFAKRLSDRMAVPYHSLDSIVWQERWQKTPVEQRNEAIQKLTEQKSWIIEGVSKQVMQKADIIYFLDIPLYRCVFNILKRFCRYGLRVREHLPAHCPEYIGVWLALKIVFLFPQYSRPWIMVHSSSRFCRITSYRGVETVCSYWATWFC